jgi:hypothetical protein
MTIHYGRTIRNVRFAQIVYHTCKKYINIFLNLKKQLTRIYGGV